jgi:NAD(P)-dependent dehydrogenase (short-subunit alcohol dehydrogenase family)
MYLWAKSEIRMSSNDLKHIGKVVLVTGASQGLGFEIAKRFVAEGASVAICARSSTDLQSAKNELLTNLHKDQQILALTCDVSVPAEVDAVFQQLNDQFGVLHAVVSNAGIYGPLGPIDEINWDEWLQAIAINLSGAAYVLRKSVVVMKNQGFGKIIQISGGGATQPHPFANSYAASKAAIVRLAETVAEELRGTAIEVNSIAPGALNTRLFEQILSAGPELVGQSFYDRTLKQKETGGAGFNDAVDLALFLASPASDGISGKLISAVWDKWNEFPNQIELLGASDVFTLRRITEQERPTALGK